MASKLGYIPHNAKSLVNNIQTLTDSNVLYASPVGFHLVSTATAGTASQLTVRQVMGGIIFHDPQQENGTLVLPTAAQLVSEMNGDATNVSIRFAILSTGDSGATPAESTLLAINTGITFATNNGLTATGIVPARASQEFVITFTDVTPGNETAIVYPVNGSAATLA